MSVPAPRRRVGEVLPPPEPLAIVEPPRKWCSRCRVAVESNEMLSAHYRVVHADGAP